MEEFKLYSVSDDYVEWLRKEFPNVYSNKINSRTHTRKYLGVVLPDWAISLLCSNVLTERFRLSDCRKK